MPTNVAGIDRRIRIESIGYVAIGVIAAAGALAPTLEAKFAIIAACGILIALAAVTHEPARWVYIFFALDLLTPPLPGSEGSPNIHIASVAILLGIFAGIVQRREWRVRNRQLLIAATAFYLSLVASLPFAIAYSGAGIGGASALRIALFTIGMYVFAWTAFGPRSDTVQMLRTARMLFVMAVLVAAIACLDFYFHFPAPAGFSDQYVWLDSGVFRRAQGLFYDASTLGNFCAFFLIYALIAISEHQGALHPSRLALAAGACILGAAMMLSYSRASILNVAIALLVYGGMRGHGARRILAGAILAAGASAAVIYAVYPEFAANYWSHIEGTIRYASERPDGVLSGRITSWRLVGSFIASHPWQTVFGIGYKTLPYTSYLGDPVVADNSYLSLLVETGIAGLTSFVLFLAIILKMNLRIAKLAEPGAAFLGNWALCFWCGQAVQMMSGDLLTYWRVMPVYLWALGAAVQAGYPRHEEST